MYNGRTAITRRGGTRGQQDDKMDEGDTYNHNRGHDEDLHGDTEVTG